MRTARRWLSSVQQGFVDNDLLTYASAIAYQSLGALIPLGLAALALLGFLGLTEAYTRELAPQLEDNLSESAFGLVDQTVREVLGERRALWLTLGAALAVWQVSGAIRATMGALANVYCDGRDRDWGPRMAVSIALSLPVMACMVSAVVVVQLGDEVLDLLFDGTLLQVGGFVVRWLIAVALLFAAWGLLVHWGTVDRQPVRGSGRGAALAIALWMVASVLFGLYLDAIADYGSVFGNLASAYVLITYVYLSSVVLLFGVQVDALLRGGRGATSG